MSFSDTWSESDPSGSTYANTLATIISQGVKRAIRERFAVDHYAYADESGHSDVGYHKKVTLPVLTEDPSELASGVILYSKDVSSKAELHLIDEDTNVIQLTSGGVLNGACPSGLIAMWHGTIANIPAGWVICDGENSTPNLLAKMIRGVATAATDPGTTGGADTHDHGAATGSHTLTTAEIPAHTHPMQMGGASGGSQMAYSGNVDQGSDCNTKQNTGGGGGHTHTIAEASSLPAYYSVAFIMKS